MLYFHKIVAIAEAQKYTGAGAAKRGEEATQHFQDW